MKKYSAGSSWSDLSIIVLGQLQGMGLKFSTSLVCWDSSFIFVKKYSVSDKRNSVDWQLILQSKGWYFSFFVLPSIMVYAEFEFWQNTHTCKGMNTLRPPKKMVCLPKQGNEKEGRSVDLFLIFFEKKRHFEKKTW